MSKTSKTISLDADKIILQLESEKPYPLDATKIFIEILANTLINEDKKNKISIKLTPEIINVINNIISLTPDTLNDIEKSVVEIVKDGKIDINDIPQFIVLVRKIYELIYSLKDIKNDYKKLCELTATVLKFIVHLLVLERKIKINDDKQEEFLNNFDLLIDSCIGLLSFHNSLKTKSCLKKIFG